MIKLQTTSKSSVRFFFFFLVFVLDLDFFLKKNGNFIQSSQKNIPNKGVTQFEFKMSSDAKLQEQTRNHIFKMDLKSFKLELNDLKIESQ